MLTDFREVLGQRLKCKMVTTPPNRRAGEVGHQRAHDAGAHAVTAARYRRIGPDASGRVT